MVAESWKCSTALRHILQVFTAQYYLYSGPHAGGGIVMSQQHDLVIITHHTHTLGS